jgi:PilZ domain
MSTPMSSQPDSICTDTWAERRRAPRYSASGEPARIAWKEEGLRVCKAPARLIDIAANGAGLVAARPAEPGEMLWLGMASLPWEWVKATIRATCPDGREWRLHVAFCEPCPVGLFEIAIGQSARNQELPSFRILRDDDIEPNTCFTIQLSW